MKLLWIRWLWCDKRKHRPYHYTYTTTYYFIILCSFVCIFLSQSLAVYVLPNKEDFKYQIDRQITENSHLTLICSEIEKESHVEWFKDDFLLNSSFRNNMNNGEEEPHLTIDAYNSLYILHATKLEEGTYACVVDGENVQKYRVKIISKSRLLNEDFIRFSMYLGFVLSLTLSCYCVGICLAWHRRSSFSDPLHLYEKKPKRVRNII